MLHALLIAALAAAVPSTAPPKLRLPDTARPTRGAIELTADPSSERYRGAVRYQVTLTRPSAIIWLHAEGLEITRATVGGQKARPITAPGGFLGLVLGRPAAAGETEVAVEFSGAFDRVRSRGLYAVAEGEPLVRLHLLRADRRAPRLPLLRRAGLQDPLAPVAPGEAG